MKNIISLLKVTKTYKQGDNVTNALDNVSLNIKEGEILVILGPSGSGKTTLLNVVSGLDKPTSGAIKYEGKDISKYNDKKITKFRKDKLGFIFQTYNLLEHINVRENVLVGYNLGSKNSNVDDIIKLVGLETHSKKYMHQLSGGEQQRVSIARALAKKPKIMFCDEPTGALDEQTGKNVLEAIVSANKALNTTILIITHNPGIAAIADRVVKMNSGKIVEIINNDVKTNPQDITWG